MGSQYADKEAVRLLNRPSDKARSDTVIEMDRLIDDEAIFKDFCRLYDSVAESETTQLTTILTKARLIGLGLTTGMITLFLTLLYTQQQATNATPISPQEPDESKATSWPLLASIITGTATTLSLASTLLAPSARNRSVPGQWQVRTFHPANDNDQFNAGYRQIGLPEPLPKAGWQTILTTAIRLGARTHNTQTGPARFPGPSSPSPEHTPSAVALTSGPQQIWPVTPGTLSPFHQWIPAATAGVAHHHKVPKHADSAERKDSIDITPDEVEEAIRFIASIQISDFSLYFTEKNQFNNRAPKKRSVSARQAENITLHSLIDKVMLNNPALPKTMHPELNTIHRRAINKTRSDATKLAVGKSLLMLMNSLDLLTQVLDLYVSQKRTSKGSYHFLSLVVHQLWELASQLTNANDRRIITQFKEMLLGTLTKNFRKQLLKKPADENDLAFNEFTKIHLQDWYDAGVSMQDKVFFHTLKKASSFTISEILTADECQFPDEKTVFYHLEFNNKGLPDNNLMHFIQFPSNYDFDAFKENYFKNQATLLLEELWQEQRPTPPYFHREKAIEILIEELSAGSDNDPAVGEVINALIPMGFEHHPNDPLTRIAFATANVLFGKINPDHFQKLTASEVWASDYIYSYTDENNQNKYDVASLKEVLCSASQELISDISQRKDVSISWPTFFNEALRSSLKETIHQTREITAQHHLEIQVQQARNKWVQQIPLVNEEMEKIHAGICKTVSRTQCNSSDRITFNYHYEIIPAAPIKPIPPKTFEHSALAILRGEERLSGSENYLRINKQIVSINGRPVTRDDVRYVNALQEFDTQGHMLNIFDAVKTSRSIKHDFLAYEKIITRQIPEPQKNKWRYEFAAAPLLVAYFSKKPVQNSLRRNPIASRRPTRPEQHPDRDIPFVVQSLASGYIEHFDSYHDFLEKVDHDDGIRKHLAAHFDIDLDGFKRLELIAMPSTPAIFDRVAEQQISNIDKLIRSHTEIAIHTAAQIVFDFSLFLTLPSMALNPVGGMILGVAVSSGSKLVQLTVADTRQQKDSLILEMAIAGILETGGTAVSAILNAGVKKLTSTMIKKMSVRRDLLNVKKIQVENPEIKFSVICDIQIQKRVGTNLCSVSLQPVSVNALSSTDEKFLDVMNKYQLRFTTTFNQDNDLLKPISSLPEIAGLNNLDDGMCLALSLSVGNQVLHGDVAGVTFLNYLKKIADPLGSAAGPGTKNLTQDQVKMLAYLHELHSKQPADFNQIKIRTLQENVQRQNDKLIAMQRSYELNKSSVAISDIRPVFIKLQALRKEITELKKIGPAEAWSKFESALQQWSARNGLTSQMLDYSTMRKVPDSTGMVKKLLKELCSTGDKAIVFYTSDHAMLLFHANSRYGFFEPNFGSIGFDTAKGLTEFLSALSALPQYQIRPQATLLRRSTTNRVKEVLHMKRATLSEIQQMLNQVA